MIQFKNTTNNVAFKTVHQAVTTPRKRGGFFGALGLIVWVLVAFWVFR